jgi:hypothetical protein
LIATETERAEIPPPGNPSNANARRFCFVFLALTLLWPVATILFARSSLYLRVSTDKADFLTDFYLNLSNQRYDVVFFGDSTCMYGVDPVAIQARTRLTAVNLCQSNGILASQGTTALDFYLLHNAKPSVLVLYLAPPGATIIPEPENIDGVKARIRHGSIPSLLLLLSAHPAPAIRALVAFSYDIVRGLLRTAATGTFQGDTLRASELKGFGFMPNNGAGTLPDGCREYTGGGENWKRHEFIDQFRKNYASLGVPILVVPGPVADCDRALPEYQRILGPVFDEMPYSIPHDMIADDGHPLHPIPVAVPEITAKLAARIQVALPDKKGDGK